MPTHHTWKNPHSSPCAPRGVALIPKRPEHDDGIRIDPPPSLPCAMGLRPAASPAAAPPLEPPGVRSGSHGFLVGPSARGSVHGPFPNSGVFVFPSTMNPAC